LSFSPFHNGLLASGGGDCVVKIWQLPEDPNDKSINTYSGYTENDALCTIKDHRHTIRTVDFHPYVKGLLVSTSQDGTLRTFDCTTGGSQVSCIDLGLQDNQLPSNVIFNLDGSMIGLACKDRIIRIVDPRANEVIMTTPDPSTLTGGQASGQLGRNLRAAWCSGSKAGMSTIFTASSANTGMRTVQLWDPRYMNKATCNRTIDNAAGQLFPMYDDSIGVCFVAGKGDTIIRSYEMSFMREVWHDAAGHSRPISGASSRAGSRPTSQKGSALDELDEMSCEKCSDFQTSKDPIAGICMLPKSMCDVRNVETTRMLKLTVNSVVPLSYKLPRAENVKTWFQDDVYQAVKTDASVSVGDWQSLCSGAVDELPPVNFMSLKPADMQNLSEKPIEKKVRPKVADFKDALKKEEEENKQKEATFNKLQDMALTRAIYHPNASGGSKGHGFKVDAANMADGEVEDDEWDD
jgi:hypothetical protein